MSAHDALQGAGYEIKGNPDAYVRDYDSFGVDDARALIERASNKGMGNSRRIFLIATPSITAEAQNSLLKLFEEPSGDSLFILIVPSPRMLLPTLLSRVHTMELEDSLQEIIDSKEFLAATRQARIELLKKILDSDERDVGGAIGFLSSLEREMEATPMSDSKKEGVEAIYRARKFIGDKGSLMKPLLEQVALLVPRIV